MVTNGATLRRSTPQDFRAWLELYEAVADEGIWIGGESPIDAEDRRRAFERSLNSSDSVTFLAETGGELVGMLGVEIRKGIAEFGMMIDARWRRRGIGTKLVEACIEWARESGAHKITLQVWPHNAGAIALYETLGFVEKGRLRRHYQRRNGQLWDALVMGLVLDWDSPGSPYGS